MHFALAAPRWGLEEGEFWLASDAGGLIRDYEAYPGDIDVQLKN